ncbi:hypothetical protein WAI453_003039 [Rhynchosporium graminicola]|uniref:Serine hydrolase domain-containing protein n=1 Tax=Rhynchosporium graminicola TaxID=2792576 RepID=A0A1E1LT78_9HELO|nr:uncharacterized protein RCO7_11414 [Rhynchosporium commune]
MTPATGHRVSHKPAILCLHSVGSSGAILRAQLSRFQLALAEEFELVFLDASFPSPAGPGILPLYRHMAPFYSWIDMSGTTTPDSQIDTAEATVRNTVQEWNSMGGQAEYKIVGVLGFSLGAMLAVHLLWQQQMGRLPWLPTLRFGILICPYFPEHMSARMHADAREHNCDRAVINSVPTVHLLGNRDIFLRRGRNLVTEHFTPALTDVMEFHGGHECPRASAICEEAAKRILSISHTQSLPPRQKGAE